MNNSVADSRSRLGLPLDSPAPRSYDRIIEEIVAAGARRERFRLRLSMTDFIHVSLNET
jgi:hypothetical protein